MPSRTAATLGRTRDGHPILAALRVQMVADPGARPAWRMVFRCPFCRAVHTHGLGPDAEDGGFGSGDGTWVPHCPLQFGDRPGLYYLRETKDPRLAGDLPRRILAAIVAGLSHRLLCVSDRRTDV